MIKKKITFGLFALFAVAVVFESQADAQLFLRCRAKRCCQPVNTCCQPVQQSTCCQPVQSSCCQPAQSCCCQPVQSCCQPVQSSCCQPVASSCQSICSDCYNQGSYNMCQPSCAPSCSRCFDPCRGGCRDCCEALNYKTKAGVAGCIAACELGFGACAGAANRVTSCRSGCRGNRLRLFRRGCCR